MRVQDQPARNRLKRQLVRLVLVGHDETAPVALVRLVDDLLQLGRVFERQALLELRCDLDAGVAPGDALEDLIHDGIGVDDLTWLAQVDRKAVVDDDDRRGSGRHPDFRGIREHGSGHGPLDAVTALGELRVYRQR